MREPILKAVSMPPRLFWAPAAVAGVNMVVQFSLMLMWVGVTGNSIMPFIISIPVVHAIIVAGVQKILIYLKCWFLGGVQVQDLPKIFIVLGEQNLRRKVKE